MLASFFFNSKEIHYQRSWFEHRNRLWSTKFLSLDVLWRPKCGQRVLHPSIWVAWGLGGHKGHSWAGNEISVKSYTHLIWGILKGQGALMQGYHFRKGCSFFRVELEKWKAFWQIASSKLLGCWTNFVLHTTVVFNLLLVLLRFDETMQPDSFCTLDLTVYQATKASQVRPCSSRCKCMTHLIQNFWYSIQISLCFAAMRPGFYTTSCPSVLLTWEALGQWSSSQRARCWNHHGGTALAACRCYL